MTLMREKSYGLIQRLREDGIETHLLILEADYQTIHDRILNRGEEEDCWCIRHIEQARKGASALPGIQIPTTGRTVEELTNDALDAIGHSVP